MKKQEEEIVVEEKKIFEINLKRTFRNVKWTTGKLYVNDEYFSGTLEDCDRGLYQGMDPEAIRKRKVYGETCIPRGRYRIDMDTISPKFSKKDWYRKNCDGGKLPRLMEVDGFDGILIHPFNLPSESYGCLGPGEPGDKPGTIKNSRKTFLKLYKILKKKNDEGYELWITIE